MLFITPFLIADSKNMFCIEVEMRQQLYLIQDIVEMQQR